MNTATERILSLSPQDRGRFIEKVTPDEAERILLRENYPVFAKYCLKIKDKIGETIPFNLNSAQWYIHKKLEAQIVKRHFVRAIILKGRQQGCSTYTEGRFYHRTSQNPGMSAFILSHEDKSTNNIFKITKRFHEHCRPDMIPHTRASNARELIFDELDSQFQVATAGAQDTGRSSTIQLFHGSECAFWPNAEEHKAGALQAVPSGTNAQGTEVILESTSHGNNGMFYDMCMAAKSGESEFELIFVPWYWQEEYRSIDTINFKPTAEEEDYIQLYGLDNEQLVWRRNKIIELGLAQYRREYPFTIEDSFLAEIKGALWSRANLDSLRIGNLPELTRITINVDPAGSTNDDSDETGITVTAKGADGDGYLLEDLSGVFSPNEWGSRVVYAYHRWQADCIVAETNYGGDMVENTIKTIDSRAKYKKVVASRGKWVRAEPVASLYDQGRIHHVGKFEKLEDQLVRFTNNGYEGDNSPDRADSAIWGFMELFLVGYDFKRLAVNNQI